MRGEIRGPAVPLALFALGIIGGGCAVAPGDPIGAETEALLEQGELPHEGAFSCDLTIDPLTPPSELPPAIERDRMLMAGQPGMRQKHLPLGPDPATGELIGGGRYLFETAEQAAAYAHFVEHEFVVDGTHFFDRDVFLAHDCHAWGVIGAHDFAPIETQIIVRTERWQVPHDNQRPRLRTLWPAIRSTAGARGYTSVWLLYNRRENLVQLVYFADRVIPSNPLVPDVVSLEALALAPPLGAPLQTTAWTRDMDRTQWVLSIWFPFVAGDQGEAALWPHSPPLPGPSCGDGLCEPSRGEDASTCATECGTTCGDAVCDAAEDDRNCPSDCPI